MEKKNTTFGETFSGMPFVYIDDFFSPSEVEEILQELDSIRPKFLDGEKTRGARAPNGELLKHAKGVFLNQCFDQPEDSIIQGLTRRYFNPDFLKSIQGKAWFLRYLNKNMSLTDYTQMLYYEDSDTYGSHTDMATVTFLYWVHKKPKKFVGGDLILEETEKVSLVHNRLLIFPSVMRHEVTPVKMLDKKDGFGRYCISNFVHVNTDR